MVVADSGASTDDYSRRARYLPGLLMLAPVGIVAAAAGWHEARLVSVVVGAAISIGVPLVLESFVRHQGLGHEVTRIAGSDGQWTTTRMLWPVDDDPAEQARNAENRRVVERATGRVLPSTIPPGADGPERLAAVIDSAVADIRTRTRDTHSYRLLHQENAEYGMWRNLRGVRTSGRVIALVAVVASVLLIVLAITDVVDAPVGELVAGLLAVSAVAAFWWTVPTDARIVQASRRYSLALFDAARRLDHDTSARSSP